LNDILDWQPRRPASGAHRISRDGPATSEPEICLNRLQKKSTQNTSATEAVSSVLSPEKAKKIDVNSVKVIPSDDKKSKGNEQKTENKENTNSTNIQLLSKQIEFLLQVLFSLQNTYNYQKKKKKKKINLKW
jgi:hypothetical protein